MESITTDTLLLLTLVAGIAGFIDAIAGGGGLLTLPALLWAGIPPIQALATNKLQGSFGTLTATYQFTRTGHLPIRTLIPAVVLTFLGSAFGTLLVQRLSNDLLSQLVPVLLMVFALYFLISPRVGDTQSKQRLSIYTFSATAGFALGFYDGFFGPGTGSFFTAAFIILLGYDLTRATAGTKLLNFTSNITSLVFFAAGGHVLWGLGLMMGLAQIGGAWVGAHLAIRHGSRIIRPLLVVISLAISIKLVFFQ